METTSILQSMLTSALLAGNKEQIIRIIKSYCTQEIVAMAEKLAKEEKEEMESMKNQE